MPLKYLLRYSSFEEVLSSYSRSPLASRTISYNNFITEDLLEDSFLHLWKTDMSSIAKSGVSLWWILQDIKKKVFKTPSILLEKLQTSCLCSHRQRQAVFCASLEVINCLPCCVGVGSWLPNKSEGILI